VVRVNSFRAQEPLELQSTNQPRTS